MAQRSLKQNNSIHLFCKKLADELNGKGQYMQIVLKPTYELRWDTKTVKEHLWRPIQKATVQKQSTTELDTTEASKVHEQLMLALTEKLLIDYVDFPSEEQTENYYNSFK
jgi:hypothetical protein